MDFTIYHYLIPVGSMIALAMGASWISSKGDFSLNVFLSCLAIGIPLLIWTGALSVMAIPVAVGIMILMLFSGKEGASSE